MNPSPTPLHDPFNASLAGRRLGRYEVLARLASGGMAAVYVARAIGVAGFERLFAIKVLHPHLAHEEEFITMFLDEARLAARIRHPNVVPTIDISDTQDAGYYLVMDYIEGDHLGALLQGAHKRGERVPSPICLRVVVDALDGLAAAHSLTDENGRPINLVHRDISPHNIMVGTDGISRITDFGVAKAEVRLSTTRDGQFKGKLAYMAPEHASSGEADQRSDLFSMGIILWETLTGRRLFRAENHAATLNKICLEPIPAPSEADPDVAPFDAVLAKALERDPEQRFQTAEEFAEAIEEAASELGGMGHQRAVGKLVRDLAGEKLTTDTGLIRASIEQISATGTKAAPVRVPAAAEAVFAPPAPTRPLPLPTPTPPPLADQLEPDMAPATSGRPPSRARPLLVTVGLMVAVGAGLGLALALNGRDNDEKVTTSQLQAVEGAQGTLTEDPAAEPPAAAAAAPVQPAHNEPTTAVEAEPEPEPAPEPEPELVVAPELEPKPAAQATRKARTARSGKSRSQSRSTRTASKPKVGSAPKQQARPQAKSKKKAKAGSMDDLMLNPYRR